MSLESRISILSPSHLLPLTTLAALSLLGCYSTSRPDDAGGSTDSTRPDGARLADAGSPLGTGDPGRCETAPSLALDARVEVDDVAAAVPPPTSCWTGGSFAHSFYALEIPAGVGVEIVTEGEDAPVPALFDRCMPGADRCRSFAANGSLAPGERRREIYYGNYGDVPVRLTLSLWWPGETPRRFVLSTRGVPVAEHGRCEDALPLIENTLVAPAARGGTYENWDCVHPPESLYYSVVVPAGHVAIPLEGAQSPSARFGCGCEPGSADPDPLVNLSASPRPIVIEARPAEAVGVRFAPLPASATCTSAPDLPLDGRSRAIEVYPRLVAGFDSCAYNDAHHYAIDVPAGGRVDITARLDTPYPSLGMRSRCDELECVREGIDRLPDGRIAMTLRNPTDAPVRRLVVVGSEGPAEGPLTGEISARLIP